jgi:CubicO group peptidase (beta-lactamase class C family)
VVKYWPQFGQAGKEHIPVRWLLSHQVGLPCIDGPLTFEEVCAWDPVIRALEAQKPLWEPGTEHVYHSVTFGYLVGEVVRRITGKSLGTFFAEEVAAPLGLHAWIGLPEEQEKNVATIHWRPRCRCRLRLRHEFVVVPDWRTTGVEPGRGGRGLPRVTDTARDTLISLRPFFGVELASIRKAFSMVSRLFLPKLCSEYLPATTAPGKSV